MDDKEYEARRKAIEKSLFFTDPPAETELDRKPDAEREFDFEDEIREFYKEYSKLKKSKTESTISYDDIISFAPHLGFFLEEYPKKVIDRFQEVFGKTIDFDTFHNGEYKYIHDLRKEDIHKLFSFKGIIKRRTTVLIHYTSLMYKCTLCGDEVSIEQDSKKRTEPKRCSSCGPRARFILNEDKSPKENIQELTLETTSESNKSQTIRVLLRGKQCNKLEVGRRVIITGLVEKIPKWMTIKDEELNVTDFMIYAYSFKDLEEEEDLNITEEDEIRIREIASSENPLKLLANSIAPAVFGNQVVKEALVLQAIKPCKKNNKQNNSLHILLCGDVGIAKSKLLFEVKDRVPRARMILGTKSSKAGIGAFVSQNDLTGEWSLEAGAIVLAHDSTLCVDELDKMNELVRQELIEPMSAGTTTIDKANLHASLPAEASVLASANPIGGNYDRTKPLASQINLSTELINRFDLVFILLDKRDENSDANIVDAILIKNNEELESEISPELFKKYILYCKNIQPKLSEGLNSYFKEFYVNLRKQSPQEKAIPINPRSINALLKLSEANAKLRLSEVVEIKDFNVAREIFLGSLDLAKDGDIIDISRLSTKVPFGKRPKMEQFLEIVHNLYEDKKEALPYGEILDKAITSMGLKKWEVDDFISNLKREMKIFEPQRGWFKPV